MRRQKSQKQRAARPSKPEVAKAKMARPAPLEQRTSPVAATYLENGLPQSGSRQERHRMVLQMQRVHGNAFVQRLLSRSNGGEVGGQEADPGDWRNEWHTMAWVTGQSTLPWAMATPAVQREGEGADEAAPAKEPTLTNARFAGIASLGKILKEKKELTKRHNGRAVRAVQQALFDMAYPLPKYRVDGKLGSETAEAIRRFREDQGLPPGDVLDASALERLDASAPPPGKTAGKTVDYARLLEDNRLTFTLAVGFDEGGVHKVVIEDMVKFLEDQGFTGSAKPGGITLYSRKKSFTYMEPDTGKKVSKEVDVEIKLITPDTKKPKESFTEGLAESDVTVYTGHARYGTGPDFDHEKSPAENFVLGVGSALHKAGRLKESPKDAKWYKGHKKMEHVLEKRKNDLEAMTAAGKFDKDKYQVWFLDACTTLHYLDELRSPELMGPKTRENLDIVGTRKPIPKGSGIMAAQAFIRSILEMKTVEQMMAEMQAASDKFLAESRAEGYKIKPMPDMFYREGFGDNPEKGTGP